MNQALKQAKMSSNAQDDLYDLPSEDTFSAISNNGSSSAANTNGEPHPNRSLRLSGKNINIFVPESPLPNHNAFQDSDARTSQKPPRQAERVKSAKRLLGGIGDGKTNGLLFDDFTIKEESGDFVMQGSGDVAGASDAAMNAMGSTDSICLDKAPRLVARAASLRAPSFDQISQ
mmetsp:Transcript_3197/g.4303  ORF Transcript_3197/g.4303 Transcript_3197/m.4303 type:complete len:174 (+) Transcript_3197:55-576(+)